MVGCVVHQWILHIWMCLFYLLSLFPSFFFFDLSVTSPFVLLVAVSHGTTNPTRPFFFFSFISSSL